MRKTHGLSWTAEFRAWQSMKDRCHNPRSQSYAEYGGRGIVVCDSWRASFMSFWSDMGPRPSSEHSLDRIDNNKGYEPGNCRWATGTLQQRNRRSVPLTEEQVLELRAWHKAGVPSAWLAKAMNVTRETMRRAMRGHTWR